MRVPTSRLGWSLALPHVGSQDEPIRLEKLNPGYSPFWRSWTTRDWRQQEERKSVDLVRSDFQATAYLAWSRLERFQVKVASREAGLLR